MNPSPLISVIVAVHDSSEYLHLCIDSILSQTLSNIEVICVDDGSEDNSLHILKEYSIKDERLHVLTQENKGAGAARNAGLDVAKGKYLLFLDSDDFFEDTMLEILFMNAELDNLDLTICQAYEYDDQTRRINKILNWAAQKSRFPKDIFSYEDAPSMIFQYINTWAWNKLILKELVDKNNIRFQELMSSNDNLFISSVLVHSKRVKILDDVLIYYRVNNPNSLQRSKERTWQCSIESAYAVGEMLEKFGLSDELRQSYINKSLKNVLYYYDSIPYDEPAKKLMMERIKNEYIPKMGFLNHPKDYYYDPVQYDILIWICEREYNRCTIPIVFASDNNYAKQMYVAAYSILKNKLESTVIDFYLLIDDAFDEKYVKDIEKLAAKYANVKVNSIRMGNRFLGASKTIEHITTPTYYRLAMAEILPEEYEKCLYLDTDIIVTSDLSEYFSLNMENDYIAGVKAASYMMNYSNWGYMRSIGIKNIKEYINAGAVLYNLKKIREDNLTPELMKRISYNYSSQDQDIINSVFSGHIRIQPLRCNLMTKYNSFFDKSLPEYKRVSTIFPDYEINYSVKNPLIIHYAGPVKPWNGMDQPLSELWWQYANECPYNDYRTIPEEKKPKITNYEISLQLKQLTSTIEKLDEKIKQQGTQINNLKKLISDSNKQNGFKSTDKSNNPLKMDYLKRLLTSDSPNDHISAASMLKEIVETDSTYRYLLVYAQLCNEETYDADLAKANLLKTLREDPKGEQKIINIFIENDKIDELLEMYDLFSSPSSNISLSELLIQRNEIETAKKCLAKAIKTNDSDAIHKYADLLYISGETEDYSECVALCESHPDNKYVQFCLARMLRDGIGTSVDLDRSKQHMKKAADLGHSAAIRCISEKEYKADTKSVIKHSLSKKGQDATIENCIKSASAGDFKPLLLLARMYQKGSGVPNDSEKSLQLCKKAVELGCYDAELLAMLWNNDRKNSASLLIDAASKGADNGDPNAIHYLGKAYRDGKGVNKDPNKAAQLMTEAYKEGIEAAGSDALEALWKIGTEESCKDMVHIATKLVENGDPRAMNYLGRAYRDGKGTDADLEKSAHYLKLASDNGVRWAGGELLGVLWKSKKYDEAVTLAKSLVKNGDVNAKAYLGRAYKEGKGVKKDLKKASELLEQATKGDVRWAKGELVEVLWRLEEYEKMVSLITPNDAHSKCLGYLGLAYRDGKGVTADLEKSIVLLNKAAQINPSWKKELKTADNNN